MKNKLIRRILAAMLTLAMMLGVCVPAASAFDESFQESRPEMEWPAAPQWTEMEVTCQSGENVLRGTLTVPKQTDGAVPVAILLHGLNTDRSWCDDIAWCLADNGIASVRFDYAGNGESDGAQEDMSVSSELQDTMAILDYVEGLEITDLDNIFIVGKSMGGVEAVLAAQSRGDEIKAMCLWYPGFGIAEAGRKGRLAGQSFNPWDPPGTLEANGYTYGRQFLKEIQVLDLESACASYEGPVMILHGDKDFVAPIHFSFQMEQVFQDCTLKVVPGGYHGFFGKQELAALEDMLRFFQEHID